MTAKDNTLAADLSAAMGLAPQATPTTPSSEDEGKEKDEQQASTQETEDKEQHAQDGTPGDGEEQTGDDDAFEDNIVYLTDLAETLEVDPGLLYDMKIKTAAGAEFTIGELKDRVQNNTFNLNEERTKFEQEIAQERQKAQQERDRLLQEAVTVAKIPKELQDKKNELMSMNARFESVDWDKFGESDPGRAAFVAQQYQVAKTRLEAEIAEGEKNVQQEREKRYTEYMQAASTEFVKRVPGWKDKEIANKEGELMTKLVIDYGIRMEEISHITDPRMRHILRDYAVLKQSQDDANANAKRVTREGKKVLRRSAISGRFMSKKDQSTEKVELARKTGDKHDIHNATKALLQEAGIM